MDDLKELLRALKASSWSQPYGTSRLTRDRARSSESPERVDKAKREDVPAITLCDS
jgi:hypothetical protein